MVFKALLNAKAAFPRLCSSFLCACCSKNLPERAPTKKQLRVLSIIDQLRAWAYRRSAYAQLSPLYPSLYPYVTHVMNYSRPSTCSLVPMPRPKIGKRAWSNLQKFSYVLCQQSSFGVEESRSSITNERH